MGRRAALLVGISEYGEGFEPLPGSLNDVQAIADVLEDPECGAFEVEDLTNCSDTSLESAIEGFFSGQDADSLLLFYFSGHGDLGSGGMLNQQLHLCAKNSRKENGRLIESSALSARFLKRQMDLCRAKQIVVILDCCYSGKIADLLTKGEGDIEFDELKASGRVILASSSAANVALQERDGLSLYTQFLIEGMEGAAYPGQGDWIVARNLHEHADRRFEIERKGSYRPKILAEDTGYDLPIVRAPKPDPKLEYRLEVDRIFQELDEELHLEFTGSIEDGLDRGSLETCRARLGLSPEDALAIEEKIQAPYLVRAKKRQDYAKYFRTAVKDGTTPNSRQRRRLTEICQNLLLGKEDAQRIEKEITRKLDLASPPKQPKTVPNRVDPLKPPKKNISDHPQEITVDPKYEKLEELLQNQKWEEADQETYRLMITIVGRTEEDWFREKDLKTFPCEDLQTLDRLWVKYSKGKWGFSVQKRIWEECGSPKTYDGDWEKFGECVGWRKKGNWLEYKQLTFDLKKTSDGEFPFFVVGCLGVLFSRAKTCRL
ncbi:GUN4 domain-containing protein [Acaryochloris marina NIES-2412]|uniref:GUN4 domain-containing protein n=1 Tax=Acaryochloris marina TaxID=155978 RepID=UPI004058950E